MYRYARRNPLADLMQEQFQPRGLDIQPQATVPQMAPMDLPPMMTQANNDMSGLLGNLANLGSRRALGKVLQKKRGSLEKFKSVQPFYPNETY